MIKKAFYVSVLFSSLVIGGCQCGGDVGWNVTDGGTSVVPPGTGSSSDAGSSEITDAGVAVNTPDAGTQDAGVLPDAGAPDAGVVCDESSIPSTGTVPDGCVRVDGSNVGLDAAYSLDGGGSLTITSWVAKSDETGYFVGFEFESSVPVSYVVKCGTADYYGTSSQWLNPNGTTGNTAQAISNVTFCVCR